MLKLSLGKNGGFIVKDIILPDVPDHIGNRSKTESCVVFLSDFHIGSKFFLEKELLDFVSWLSEPDPVAQKIRFVVIGGDIIDGIGIYPNQDKELVFSSIEGQLEKAFEIIEKIPKTIKVFVISGNHDPGRRALPQPAIPKKYYPKFWESENIFMIGNPSMISLNGVKVLMYHGQSIDDVVKTTPGLSYDNPTNVMRNLLQARHLSPTFGSSTPIAPETEDMMVIEEMPDIFFTGHVHVAGVDLYKGILLINSGAWQKQTPFQTSVGITPTPSIAIITNLKTFKVYYKNFGLD
jgi:DNA polymerase II small subunit